jgi:hypothetical protein
LLEQQRVSTQWSLSPPALEATDMDAALYFELVDAIAKVDRNPSSRRSRSRADRHLDAPAGASCAGTGAPCAREAIALQSQFVMSGIFSSGSLDAKPLEATR